MPPKEKKSPTKPGWRLSCNDSLWILALSTVLAIVFAASTGYLYFENLQLKQKFSLQPAPSQIKQTTESPKPTEKPKVPDYTSSTTKKVSTFDITTWKTYVDNEVGLRLRYPAKWGSPSRTLDYCTESCSSDNITPAWFYRVVFPRSQFTIGGGSENWAPARGNNILYDFTGFLEEGSPETKDYWPGRQSWFSRQRMCETPWLLSCNVEPGGARYTSTLSCSAEPGSGYDYERVLLLDVLNGNKLRGVALGGNFIPEDAISADQISCDEEVKEAVDQALNDRKLDSRTMETYDLYNAVFDTVEIF